MAALLDAVMFNPTLGGTTDWVVSSAVQGYMTPAQAGAGNGKTYFYRAESADLSQWEVGYGTYSTGTVTLTRNTVLYNSAGTTAKINFSSAPQVGIVLAAQSVLNFDEAMASLTVTQKSQARANLNVGVHGTDIASAATVNLQTATGDVVDITGTTTITAITLNDGEVRTVRFTGALTLTHGASLVLPGAANILTAAGDFATIRGYAAGVVRVVHYTRASLAPIDGAAWTSTTPTPTFASGAGTCTIRYKQIGKTVHVDITVTCTTSGTFQQVAAPVAVQGTAQQYYLVGREIARTGIMWWAVASGSSAAFGAGTYNNGTAAMLAGDTVVFSGTYEAA